MDEKVEYYTITKEIMKEANIYLPLTIKVEFAQKIAKLAIEEELEITTERILPRRVRENVVKKNMGIMQILLTYYLKDKETLSFENYDYYAGGIIMNQLERFKSDNELKTKAFDLLTDFKEFKNIVNTEIHYEIERQNDILNRFMQSLDLLNDPETLKKAAEYLKNIDVKKTTTKKATKKVESNE